MDVTLEKGDDGLGITVAGYVSPDSTNNGKYLIEFDIENILIYHVNY